MMYFKKMIKYKRFILKKISLKTFLVKNIWIICLLILVGTLIHCSFNFDCDIENYQLLIDKKGHLVDEDNGNFLKKHSTEGKEASMIPTCHTIEVVVICHDFRDTQSLTTLFKSIAFHEKNYVHFYILYTNEIIRRSLDTLFGTWLVPGVTFTFINATNSQLSTDLNVDVLKLLPSELTQVIMLNPNLVFTGDIVDLWNLFENMNDKFLGLVKSQDEGYNTDVMLLNLANLRTFQMKDKYAERAEANLLVSNDFIANHNAFRSLIKTHPDMIYQIPCEWNIQFNNKEACFNKTQKWKGLNLNLKNQTGLDGYFEMMQLSFFHYDGLLLRKKQLKCGYDVNAEAIKYQQMIKSLNSKNLCDHLEKSANTVYRTHPYYISFNYTPTENDVSLVTHLTFSRFSMLIQLAQHWLGPISAAIYLNDYDVPKVLKAIYSNRFLSNRQNIGYHLVYQEGDFYPINYLRNIALNNSNTPFVFLLDADFVPSYGLYFSLQKFLTQANDTFKTAYVIPAFEYIREISYFSPPIYPKSKSHLLYLSKKGYISTFNELNNPVYHAQTNYSKWIKEENPYQIKWAPRFEPYILVHRNVTRFDQRFVGYGWNKISHIFELYLSGYQFIVLPHSFIVHYPHTKSADKFEFYKPSFQRCLYEWKNSFIRDSLIKYPKAYLSTDVIQQLLRPPF